MRRSGERRTPVVPGERRASIAGMSDSLAAALTRIEAWGADHAAAALIGPAGVIASHGDPDHVFRWASVTKLVTALAVLVGVDGRLIDLDEPAGPPGSTVRHLLAHASGLNFEGDALLAAPGKRRIYSNPGYDRLGAVLAERAGTPVGAALEAHVLSPLGMDETRLTDRPSQGLTGPLSDLVGLAGELLRPTLLAPHTYAAMRTVAFPGLAGVLPGVGRYDQLDWGLGPELRDDKRPHWTGTTNSSATFGHIGGAGTFLWVDPALDLALVCLTDREFEAWALEAWPALSDAVIVAVGDAPRSTFRRSGCAGLLDSRPASRLR